ncbi:MAG: hypothetical protein L0220_35450, partial [Acidobacteria bacterium]|nr:hypothetical protein [Acidobacteriota bacterium]
MFSHRARQTLVQLVRRSGEHRWGNLLAVALITLLAIGVSEMSASLQRSDEKSLAPGSHIPSRFASRSHLVTTALRDVSSTAATTVSAASYEAPIAPDSIVSAFGTQLAIQTAHASDADPNSQGIQLPTDLVGTTVDVNGRRAALFFVSAGQVNYMIPAETEPGMANVVVRSGDGTITNGTVQVVRVAPAIFAANSDGRGVAAATLLRIKTDGSQAYEGVSEFIQTLERHIAKPIEMGPEGEKIFLILYLSGIRQANDPNGDGNLNENTRVLIGGIETVPHFVGRHPDFVGLDQINVEIPRTLIGRGVVNVSVSATGFSSSNLVNIAIAGTGGTFPPQVSGFGSPSALAGNTIIINGNGFSPNPADNIVRIAGLEAQVMSASASQLTVMVPFGVETGMVTVRTAQGEGVSASVLPVRTSVSGLVENTARQPMSGVTVKVSDFPITETTNDDGAFVLPDVPAGAHFVEIDGGSLQTDPPYPKVTLKIIAQSNRDNQFSRPIALQQQTGTAGTIGGSDSSIPGENKNEAGAIASTSETADIVIQTGDFQLSFPDSVRATFPNGATRGTIFLTPLLNGRTPVDLPFGFYSSSIVQITPFGVKFDPGGKLIFPNTDGFPAGASAQLFRYDPSQGKFVVEARAFVTADGKSIETEPGAVKIASYYFACLSRETTTITGRVLERDGKTIVSRALVRFRGQESFTDGNGSFVLRQ